MIRKGNDMKITIIAAGVYLIAVNLIAFILYGADKHKAKQGKWRISEKTLLGIAVIGGSIGALLGMQIFHHKTKHWYFRYGVPFLLIVQAAAVWLICRQSI